MSSKLLFKFLLETTELSKSKSILTNLVSFNFEKKLYLYCQLVKKLPFIIYLRKKINVINA